jgi:arylsulfatase A-like enzyme
VAVSILRAARIVARCLPMRIALRAGRVPRVFALLVAAVGCDRPPPPNVLVLVIDTLRADHVGWMSDDPELTPFLDTLAARATVFRRAYAPSSWTGPAVASLWTSRYQSQHGISSLLAVLSDKERTLAEVLRKHGWATGGFSANPLLSTELGYAQGFDRYEFRPPEGTTVWLEKERAEQLHAKALAWLDTLPSGTPAFLYFQYMEPHFPYGPPEEFKWKGLRRRGDPWDMLRMLGAMLPDKASWKQPNASQFNVIRGLYDGEIMALDVQLRELFSTLESRGFLRNAIVIVTSDHGDEFDDHGRLGHGHTLYDELLHVPLLVLHPGQQDRLDVDEVVSLVDLAPTVLDLLDILRPAPFEGRSLAATIRTPSLVRRGLTGIEWLAGHRGPTAAASYSELVSDSSGTPVAHHHATVVSTHKAIVHTDGKTETYDLAADPDERQPGGLDAAAVERVETVTHELARRATRDPSPNYVVAPDANTTARLRALGYVD